MKNYLLPSLLGLFITLNLFAQEKPIAGKWYYIKAPDNTFLSFDPMVKKFVSGNPDNKTKFKVSYRDDGKIFLQLADKEYLSASYDKTVTVKPNPWDWEAFNLEKAPGDSYYLFSHHHNYLHANVNNNTLDLSPTKDTPFKFIHVSQEQELKIPAQDRVTLKFTFSDDQNPKEFIIDKDILKQFKSIDTMLSDLGGYDNLQEAIPLFVSSSVFQRILDALTSAKKELGYKAFEKDSSLALEEIVREHFHKSDNSALIDIALAANYLDVDAILHVAAKQLAHNYKDICKYDYAEIEALHKKLPADVDRLISKYIMQLKSLPGYYPNSELPGYYPNSYEIRILKRISSSIIIVDPSDPNMPSEIFDIYGNPMFKIAGRVEAISPDGTFGVKVIKRYNSYISGDEDIPVIFSLKDGQDLIELPGHGWQDLRSVKISDDNNYILVGPTSFAKQNSRNNEIQIFSKDGKLIVTFEPWQVRDLSREFSGNTNEFLAHYNIHNIHFTNEPSKDPSWSYLVNTGPGPEYNTTEISTPERKILRILEGGLKGYEGVAQVSQDTVLVITKNKQEDPGPVKLWYLDINNPEKDAFNIPYQKLSLPLVKLIAQANEALSTGKEYTLDADFKELWKNLDPEIRKYLEDRFRVKVD